MDGNKNIKRIDFVQGTATSDGKIINGTEVEMSILFNQTVISAEEVRKLIETEMHEYDQRVICVTKVQADNLKGNNTK